MFKAKVRPDVLKEVVDVISTTVDETKITASKTGISIKAVDPAHVAMIDLSLSKGGFEEYKADDVTLGVDMDKIKEVLRLAKPGDMISIEHDSERNRLIFKVGNITRKMSLVDTTGMSEPKVPNLNLPVKIVVKTDEIRQGIRASESVSDHIALVANSEGFEMVSEGDTDSVNLKLGKDMLEELKCKEETRSLFPLDYFSSIFKTISTASVVTMHMGSDYPVKLEFTIANGKGEVTYLLAPRIESE
ncbi:MAG: proliferating cell nuclear antigen (pcna) [Thermoplasmata archaeon]|nr:proliferating cell nuclear antigen (pcna) [Thermoplasmata archaeon]